jgi:large subunit ribosomal protein L6
MRKKIEDTIELPSGVQATVEGRIITVKGKKEELKRELKSLAVNMTVVENKVILSSASPTKREKRMIGSMHAHINNMIAGVTEGHIVTLKICASHFPMNVTISGKDLIVKNFFGGKVPRVLRLKEGVDVKIEGNIVKVTGADKDLVGQCAASIEQLCRITNRDKRIFQDGIYIINKYGQEIQ